MASPQQSRFEITSDSFLPQCVAFHRGIYCIEPHWFRHASEAVAAGAYPMRAEIKRDERGERLYSLNGVGVATIGISGPIIKGDSKFEGTNSVTVRKAFAAALADEAVKGIFLAIDSPGGMVAGTAELADDIAAAKTVKPVVAHIDGLGASAAYWIASQAERVTASATSEIGSIGVYVAVEDSSKQAEMMGVKVHIVSTGDYKGALEPGTPVTEDILDAIQVRVDDINKFFVSAVADGRKMSAASVRELADGMVWIAAKAKAHGLIDGVKSMQEAIDEFAAKVNRPLRRSRSAIAAGMIDAAGRD